MARHTHPLLTLLAAALLLGACTVQGGAEEEDPRPDAGDTSTSEDTGDDDTATDTSPPDQDSADDDTTSPDVPPIDDTTVDDTTVDDTTDVSQDPCQGPLRLEPDAVTSAGGEVVWATGQEFYIGALEWWLVLEGEIWIEVDYSGIQDPSVGLCAMPFRVPPLPPGDYRAAVVYGWPGSPEPPDLPLTLHVEAATGRWVGAQPCNLATQGDCPTGQHCQLGLGFCAWDDCGYVSCDNGADQEVCDPLFGCGPPVPACESNADCEMIYSSCGCMALHVSDPRLQTSDPFLTACELDACNDCDGNECERLALWPACDTATGRCIEMPPL